MSFASSFTSTTSVRRAAVAAPRSRGIAVRSLAAPLPVRLTQRRLGGKLACRAQASSEDEGSHDFHGLAKMVAGRLASELAGQDDTFNKLQAWLGGESDSEEHASGDAGAQSSGQSAMQAAARIAADYLGSSGSGKQHGSSGGVGETLTHMAADYLGSNRETPRTDQAADISSGSMLSSLAAEYLGINKWTADSVKSWLSNPSNFEERDDSKMVGAVVHRLLQSFERHTGEDFKGSESQFDWLYNYTKSILGSSITRSLLKKVVKAYLGLPMG